MTSCSRYSNVKHGIKIQNYLLDKDIPDNFSCYYSINKSLGQENVSEQNYSSVYEFNRDNRNKNMDYTKNFIVSFYIY